ncbi:class C sortase [Peptoniphilus sp.]|jgi:sortase A|uniref:class C sortase n=1 Tax=Peptoniphilus sp. TaxID=1971214 RepID=UPI003D90B217
MLKDKVNLILFIFLILGISLLLYPSIADYWNASRSTKVISEYNDGLKNLSSETIEREYNRAVEYNKKLLTRNNSQDKIKEMDDYYNILKVGNNDVMANIYIPSINVRLPIYHGTDENILQSGLGHIEWTSLPVGGVGTHSAITGHRGLVSARLFTDIDQLEPGDIFKIYVLDKELDYQVDNITVVEPHETKDLLIDKDKDLVTLVTCTPYGINTHRLLVRGKRIDGPLDLSHITSEAYRIKPTVVAAVMIIPASIIFGAINLAMDRRRK